MIKEIATQDFSARARVFSNVWVCVQCRSIEFGYWLPVLIETDAQPDSNECCVYIINGFSNKFRN